MNVSVSGEQRKRGKWSRWADDDLTDDEDTYTGECRRRIVNESTLLGSTGVAIAVSSSLKEPDNQQTDPVVRQHEPEPINKLPEQCALNEPPPLMVHRGRDDVLSVFCEDEMGDLHQIPDVSANISQGPEKRPAKFPDLRESLKKGIATPPYRSRPQGIRGGELVPHRPRNNYCRPGSFGCSSNRRFVPYNGPGRTGNRGSLPQIQPSDICRNFRRMGGCPRFRCRFLHQLPILRKENRRSNVPSLPRHEVLYRYQGFPPVKSDYNQRERPPFGERDVALGPLRRELEGAYQIKQRPRYNERSRFEEAHRLGQENEDENNAAMRLPRRELEGAYQTKQRRYDDRSRFEEERRHRGNQERADNSCLVELLRQNGQIQEQLRRLEQHHANLEIRAIDQHNIFSRRLEHLADFQRTLVIHLLQKEPVWRAIETRPSSTGGIGNSLQQSAQRNGILGRKPFRYPDSVDPLWEDHLARQLVFQHRSQSGLRSTEQQLLLQHGVYNYNNEVPQDRYWR